ncbi:hypothetical protein KI387_028488, partial [Taxus chinensis]
RNFNNTNGAPARDRPRLALAQSRLEIKSPPVNVVVEIVEKEEEPEEQDSPEAFEASGYTDESYDDSTGDSSIGYLEYEEDECAPDGQSFSFFTRSQSKNPRKPLESPKEKNKEPPIAIVKRGAPISAQTEREVTKKVTTSPHSLSPK